MTWAPAYSCIAMDPPWWETGGGKITRGAQKHYDLIKTKEMPRVILQAPCWRPADNAHLWMWVTNRFLPDGLWLMEALGFRYVTNRAWAKMEPAPERQIGWFPQRPGLGQYLRGQHELLLFGVRGRLPALWKAQPHPFDAHLVPPDATREGCKAPGTLLLAPRGEHSQKPQQAYDDITSVSLGPRLEMFARGPREGWDVWGDEVPDDPSLLVNILDDVPAPVGSTRLRGIPCPTCRGYGSVQQRPDPRLKCTRCDGIGRMPGADLCCRVCDGTGRQGNLQRQPCPRCSGTGEIL